jgi:hypothetical protein
VGDDEPATVEHVVAHEPVEKPGDLLDELRRLLFQLGHGLREAVGQADLPAAELADEPHVVVAGHAEGRPGAHHPHHQPQDIGRVGAAVDQVPDEDRLPALGRPDVITALGHLVPEALEEFDQLFVAPVHVADDVERAALVFEVGPQPLALDRRRGHLFRRREY